MKKKGRILCVVVVLTIIAIAVAVAVAIVLLKANESDKKGNKDSDSDEPTSAEGTKEESSAQDSDEPTGPERTNEESSSEERTREESSSQDSDKPANPGGISVEVSEQGRNKPPTVLKEATVIQPRIPHEKTSKNKKYSVPKEDQLNNLPVKGIIGSFTQGLAQKAVKNKYKSDRMRWRGRGTHAMPGGNMEDKGYDIECNGWPMLSQMAAISRFESVVLEMKWASDRDCKNIKAGKFQPLVATKGDGIIWNDNIKWPKKWRGKPLAEGVSYKNHAPWAPLGQGGIILKVPVESCDEWNFEIRCKIYMRAKDDSITENASHRPLSAQYINYNGVTDINLLNSNDMGGSRNDHTDTDVSE